MTINYMLCRKTSNLARVLEWPRLRISDDTSVGLQYVTVYLIFTYLKRYQYHCILWSWLTKAICTFVHEDRTRSVSSTANLCANWFCFPGFPWMFESSCCTWFLCFILYTLSILFHYFSMFVSFHGFRRKVPTYQAKSWSRVICCGLANNSSWFPFRPAQQICFAFASPRVTFA